MTEEYLHGGAGDFLAATIFSCCKERGHVALEEGDTYLYCVAPRPLASGYMPEAMLQEFPFRFLPPPEQAERLSFQERVQVGFQLALGEGLDVFFGLASILARVGEQFGSAGERQGISAKLLLSPKASWRMIRGIVRSKRAKRRMLPKDIWRLKGLVAGGVDTDLYRSKVKEYWGVEPVEVYASTETGIISMQTWERKGLVFTPSGNFLEFMPWDEYDRFGEADGYQPKTLLLDEVEVGESYVIVCTNFRGGPFVRYVLGDMITITSRESRPLGIDIPHMVFHSRVDDIIDIAGFTRLTEKSIWRALEDSAIAYVDWTARKESADDQQPLLHLYLEVSESERRSPTQIASAVHLSLQNVDNDYADLERVLGIKPLHVTLLAPGTSDRFLDERQTAGADLGFLKPRHVNTRDEDIELLMSLSRSMGEAKS